MRGLILLGALVLIVAVAWMVYVSVRHAARQRRGYHVTERKVNGGRGVGISAPDGSWEIQGTPVSSLLAPGEWEETLSERRVLAEDRCATLNEGRGS